MLPKSGKDIQGSSRAEMEVGNRGISKEELNPVKGGKKSNATYSIKTENTPRKRSGHAFCDTEKQEPRCCRGYPGIKLNDTTQGW